MSTCILIEPTESETLEEIDRFCEAMIKIREEVEDIVTGKQPKDNNVLKNAPHTQTVVIADDWDRSVSNVILSSPRRLTASPRRPYSRETAVYPVPWLKEKFWPTVSRIDDAYGDMNLICDCPSVEEMAEAQ